jgi:uncharacterized protein (TIGR00255 family)
MIRSMTGFARLKRDTPLGEASFSIKSVNHRAFDLQLYLAAVLDPFEADLRAVMKRHAARGHIEVRIGIERAGTTGVVVRRDLLEAYIAAFRDASEAYGISGAPDLNAALQIPGMIQENATAALAVASDDEVRASVTGCLDDCCAIWNQFREREGAELAADMRARITAIREAAQSLAGLRQAASDALKKRLEERLAEMALKLEPARLSQEVALLVERSDIAEEIARLTIHVNQLFELLDSPGEIGKKLDFLLQETNRETNTILAKSANAGEAGISLGDLALFVKSEIEKIREQSLNVE